MENILLEKNYHDHQHIALIRLNRPKVLNALSTDLMNELVQTLFELEDDPDIRVIILTGNERAFAAGADIAQMVEATSIDQLQGTRFRSWSQISLISKPIIAAVSGFALGGGCELAMSCDLLIADQSAKFGQPEISIGTIPGAGGTQRLTRAIGKARAMKLILTGEMFTAAEAYEWGLLSELVPNGTLLIQAFEMAKKIAGRAPIAVRLGKEAVNKAFEMSLKDAMDFERRNFYLTFSSSDQKEGMRAFLEKRSPTYKGN